MTDYIANCRDCEELFDRLAQKASRALGVPVYGGQLRRAFCRGCSLGAAASRRVASE